MEETDDCGELVSEPERGADLSQRKPSVLERLQDSECFLEVKDQPGRDGIIIAPTAVHDLSLADPG